VREKYFANSERERESEREVGLHNLKEISTKPKHMTRHYTHSQLIIILCEKQTIEIERGIYILTITDVFFFVHF